MKLGAIWTVYNGLELLEGSINQIKSEVDEVIVCYQTTSNHGEESRLNFEGINATFSKFEPNLGRNPKYNEKIKHKQCVIEALKLGCTHFILLATDHFYKGGEFRKAKQIIDEGDYDSSATKMYTYIKNPEWRLDPIEDYYCPFISKAHFNIRFSNEYPVHVDPSCGVSPCENFREFKEGEIMLHHYSWIRKDIKSKLNNAASKENWDGKDMYKSFKKTQLGGNFDYYPDKTIIKGEKLLHFPNF